MSNERTRAEISAIIASIEAIDPKLRMAARQEEDWEAYEIVRRIERRLLGLPAESPEEK